mgnify:CR=1 FL=1
MASYDVREVVPIDIDIAIESDINSWNEYLMVLVAEPMLQDISWLVVGVNDNKEVMLEVTGFVDREDE